MKKKQGNKYDTMSLIKRLEKGESMKALEQEMKAHDKEVAKKPGKMFGECESCGMETVLVEEVGLCGPCCFGEAETIHGNW